MEKKSYPKNFFFCWASKKWGFFEGGREGEFMVGGEFGCFLYYDFMHANGPPWELVPSSGSVLLNYLISVKSSSDTHFRFFLFANDEPYLLVSESSQKHIWEYFFLYLLLKSSTKIWSSNISRYLRENSDMYQKKQPQKVEFSMFLWLLFSKF